MNLQLTLAARYLWGRKLRSFLTTLAVTLGVLVIFGLNTMLPTMLAAFQTNLQAASGLADVAINHNTGESFSPSLLRRVRAVEGVRAVAGSLNRTVSIPDGFYGRDAKVSALTLVGLEPRSAQTIRDYVLKQGRFLRPEDTTAAVISTSLADTMGLKLGDTLRLPATEGVVKLRVVGLLPPRTIPGNEEVLVTLAETQKLLSLPDRINTIEANLDTTDAGRHAAIEEAIAAQLGGDYQLGAQAGGSELMASIRAGQVAYNLFGFLALLMGGFIIFNTFRTVVAERRHDIGMLRAVGASRRTITGLVLTEGLLQGVVGSLAGILLGYLMGAGLIAALGPIMKSFLHIEFGPLAVSPSLVAVSAALGVGVTLLAGLLPALSASRVTPLEALRPSAAETAQRVASRATIVGAVMIVLAFFALISGNVGLTGLGGLLFLAGLVLVAPVLVRPIANVFSRLVALAFAREGTGSLAQGNVSRQPSRAAMAASATMIGLAIIVGMAGMSTSTVAFSRTALQKSMGSDYMLLPPSVSVWSANVGADRGLADRLRSTPGVGTVSGLRFAAAEVGGETVSLLGIDPVAYPKVAGLSFQAGDPGAAYAALGRGRTLIANGVFAATAGVKVGDTVRLSTPMGARDYRVVAIASDYFNVKLSTAYISHDSLRTDFRKADDVLVQLNLAPGARPKEVEPRLKAAVARYPQFRLISRQGLVDELTPKMEAAFNTIYLLVVVMAVPSLIALLNTLAIGVIERTREIGMLRAIGATQRQVRRMVVAESLLLAAIGTAFGLLAGLYLSYVIVVGISAFGVPMPYTFPAAGLVAAIAAGLLFGVVAAILPARQATRLEIVRALRYE